VVTKILQKKKRKFYLKQVKRISIIVFLFLSVSCANKNEVEPERLAKAYVDLLVVEDFYKDTDSLNIKREQVFQKYSLTEELYDSAYKQISFDVDRWEIFFNLANVYLDTLKAKEKSFGNVRAKL
jgi:hypothetical protein